MLEEALASLVKDNSAQRKLLTPLSKKEQQLADKQWKALLVRKERSRAKRAAYRRKLKHTASVQERRARGYLAREQATYYEALEHSIYPLYLKKYGKDKFLTKEEWEQSSLDSFLHAHPGKYQFRRVDPSQKHRRLHNVVLIDKATKEIVWKPTNEQIESSLHRPPVQRPQRRVRRPSENLRTLTKYPGRKSTKNRKLAREREAREAALREEAARFLAGAG